MSVSNKQTHGLQVGFKSVSMFNVEDLLLSTARCLINELSGELRHKLDSKLNAMSVYLAVSELHSQLNAWLNSIGWVLGSFAECLVYLWLDFICYTPIHFMTVREFYSLSMRELFHGMFIT